MDPKIWVQEIEFNSGKKIQFDQNDIVLLVGPNNAGKSATLREVHTLLAIRHTKTKIIKSIRFGTRATGIEAKKFVEQNSIIRDTQNQEPHYTGYGYDIYSGSLENDWNNLNAKGSDGLAKVFSKFLNTVERLTAADPAPNIKLTTDSPQHPINFLQKSDKLEKQFSEYVREAFGVDLVVHRNAGSIVPLYVGQAPKPAEAEDRLSETYQKKLEELDLLQYQGDGMKSFVGVLLNAFISFKSLFFIDEPEAFLHPPQARLLGKMLSKDLPVDRQLFVASHSSDFLKGLLESNVSKLKIIRIERSGNLNIVNVLNNEEINTIWNDSLLRHSNILDGLFHSQVIITESDSDCRFYSAIQTSMQDKNKSLTPDTLYLNCGGKHRLPTVIKALKELGVKIKVVADFDILNDINPLRDIFEKSGGNWVEIEKDWKLVKTSIEAKRPQLETAELKREIDEIFLSVTQTIIPKEKIQLLQSKLKKASAWNQAKEVGKFFIPSGEPTKAFDTLNSKLKEKNIFIVEVGELESFCKSIGNHGPKWVNDVLAKDLATDPELEYARKFVESLID